MYLINAVYCTICIVLADYHSTTVSNVYWTDAREITGSVPGTWVWGDGTLLNYDPWRPNDPNAAADTRAVITKYDVLMRDRSDFGSNHFICKRK